MKYTKAERLATGKRIYDGELTKYNAAVEYGISLTPPTPYGLGFQSTGCTINASD